MISINLEFCVVCQYFTFHCIMQLNCQHRSVVAQPVVL